ncbi:ATP phosphoribosyltransferase [Clostridiisalibacter paucivorans]|uniref:ATP phosphoribosyltransferase n=1 Tax=Clostridiisalibacter paucivorans TaxID=408753 RepID=UPI00047D158E|nr:ATP phosphoribosyltransferase [Clostridiisalibacter paucivorans]
MEYINIALAKGRLGDKGYKILKDAGFQCKEMEGNSRKLIFRNQNKKIMFVMVKASDVPVYVERGAVDLGIVGKDTIMEEERDVYEILDLGFGKCKFSVASTKDFDNGRINGLPLRVATKYPNVAKRYFEETKKQIEIIKLNGSVELAPIVGLSDVIVDIVETGNTLRANGLEIIEDMYDISARLICNKVSFKIKNKRIKDLIDGINGVIIGGSKCDRCS